MRLKTTQKQEGDATITIVDIPAGTQQVTVEDHPIQVSLPENEEPTEAADPQKAGFTIYHFPKNCRVRHAPVQRVDLSVVIAISVAAICLWGTLMGSMLPLVFKRLGVDPGIASSPFVATFVDVTGIIIYFSIASVFLLAG